MPKILKTININTITYTQHFIKVIIVNSCKRYRHIPPLVNKATPAYFQR